MNVEEQWKNIGKGDSDLSSLLQKGITKISSKDPLEKIKSKLLINGIIGLSIAAGYVLILIFFPEWQVLVCIGIVWLLTVWLSIKTLSLYNEIKRQTRDSTMLQEMERHHDAIKKWIRIQQKAELFIYPPAAAGGFMVGGSLGSGKSVHEVMQNQTMIIALLIAIAVLVPIGFYSAKWLCKKMFGNYINQLEENINKLKSSD